MGGQKAQVNEDRFFLTSQARQHSTTHNQASRREDLKLMVNVIYLLLTLGQCQDENCGLRIGSAPRCFNDAEEGKDNKQKVLDPRPEKVRRRC